MAHGEEQHHAIHADDAGTRLDRWLCDRFALSRRDAQRLLAAGRVQLDGRYLTARDKGQLLAVGQRMTVQPLALGSDAQVQPNSALALDVLAQGDDAIIVNKPAGVAVHPLIPGEQGETNTLLNAVAARYPVIQGVGEGGLRSGVVHRLDLDTTGCVAFALSQSRWEAMRDAFVTHAATKTYRAIVHGRVDREQHREVMHLHIAQHRPAKVRVIDPRPGELPQGTRRCALAWRAIEPLRYATLIEVSLETGFLHQIRVMMAHLGHGVVGDRVYGDDAHGAQPNVARQMLHASRLQIGELVAACDDPPDFRAAIDALRR